MPEPVVSIITPSFNRGGIITETAESIFAQTYPHWEWVIVDDGSTDDSWNNLELFAKIDTRVKIFKRDREPKGACTCRNIAIQKCTGQYLLFLDTDDLLASFCLQQRVAAAQQNPACDFVIFPMLLFKNKPDDLNLLWNTDRNESELARVLRSDPICQGTGTLWKKSSFTNMGMWKEGLAVWQDVELHIRSLLGGMQYCKKMNLPPDVFLRISDQSMSRTGYDSIIKVRSRVAVFEFALNNILNKKMDDAEWQALKIMGFHLFTGAVKSAHFTEAKKLLKLCQANKMFEKNGYHIFKNYFLFRKYKGYKLPFAEQYFYGRVDSCIPKANQTVGKIKYKGAIAL